MIQTAERIYALTQLLFSCDDAAMVGIDDGHERFPAAHVRVVHDFFQLPEGLTRQQKIKASHLGP